MCEIVILHKEIDTCKGFHHVLSQQPFGSGAFYHCDVDKLETTGWTARFGHPLKPLVE